MDISDIRLCSKAQIELQLSASVATDANEQRSATPSVAIAKSLPHQSPDPENEVLKDITEQILKPTNVPDQTASTVLNEQQPKPSNIDVLLLAEKLPSRKRPHSMDDDKEVYK